MPPVCAVPIDAAVKIIQKFIENFKQHELPTWSDLIWEDMSQALKSFGFHWTAKSYTIVRENRRNMLSMARDELGVKLEPLISANSNSESELSKTNDSDDSGSKDESFGKNESIKNLVLSEAEWDQIKPSSKDGNLQLQPKVWTNAVASTIWLQYRMPCAFVFKRNKVRYSPKDESYAITFHGVCKSSDCENTIRGRGK